MEGKALWEKNTIIKDSVHGYINIPKPIANKIIDTDVFQRLKNIEQTGMQVLYPSATHNRFMHSLGVYHLSKIAFHHFMLNVQADYPDLYESVATRYSIANSEQCTIKGAESVWRRWELMFHLASLLHDCGHSPFSHTLEFVYDLAQTPESLSESLIKHCTPDFGKDFRKQAAREGRSSVGKAHERMSALLVTMEEEKGGNQLKKTDLRGGYRDRIKELIESYLNAYGIYNVYETNEEDIFQDDIDFMVRMIIGCRYDIKRCGDANEDYFASTLHPSVEEKEGCDEWLTELQIRNCIIGMLNSKLDVDNLDYVVRDSKYSGYASNNIDLERLLSSFTVINAYEYKDSALELHKDCFFEGSVNLDSFEGSYIQAKVSGECAIDSIDSPNKNIEAHGNIITDQGDLSPHTEKVVFRTKESFSANIYFSGSGFRIHPKVENKKAYIRISGYLEGKLKGIVLGGTYEGTGERRVFFAYTQNCMSVLMSAIEGSNFENKWIYAHHTTTFKNNYLLVYLLERYTEYLVDCKVNDFLKDTSNFTDKEREDVSNGNTPLSKDHEEEIKEYLIAVFPGSNPGYDAVRECLEKREIADEVATGICIVLKMVYLTVKLQGRHGVDAKMLSKVAEKLQTILVEYSEKMLFFSESDRTLLENVWKKYENIGALEIQYCADIIAMLEPKEIQKHVFYKTDDEDLLTEYKQLYHKLQRSSAETQNRYQEFIISYQQMNARVSMTCMWKTYPEYNFYFSDWTKDEIEEFQTLIRRPNSFWGESDGEKQKNYSILSDYISLTDDRQQFWMYLKNEFHIKRLVYVEQAIKTKSFVPYETYMKNQNRVFRLEDIRLYSKHKNDVEFFFIYYDMEEEGQNINPLHFLQKIREWMKKKEEKKDSETSKKYIEEYEEKEQKQRMDENGNMIIRDNVHGDIIFPPFFKEIVDTKEFQRLRRIKQLATAGQVYPGAVHTRFAHSIGTYHIMRKIVNHFKQYFKRLSYDSPIDDKEEMAILAAALLHDIGHGPYSHTFEKVGLPTGNRKHEQWTEQIIRNTSTDINKILRKAGEEFPEKVLKYIQAEEAANHGKNWNIEDIDEKLNLSFIFASLVSGQIDADRMDYLLRDAKAAGVTFGKFDLERMIEGLAVSVENTGRYRVCILEDYMPDVEEYFTARYQMYNGVYHHPYKMLSEELFRHSLIEARQEMIEGRLAYNMVPPALENIFIQADIEVDMYCQLDDSVIDGAAQTWSLYKNSPKLSFLCRSRLERSSYYRIDVVDEMEFCNKAEAILGKQVFEQSYLIKVDKQVFMYEKDKPVYILMKSGIIQKLQECSNLKQCDQQETYFFYSRQMAEEIYHLEKQKLDEFARIIEKCNILNNMEIEKKYVFSRENLQLVKERVQSYLKQSRKYRLESEEQKSQRDIYYDTKGYQLYNNDCTLRFRHKEGQIYITYKCSISSESSGIRGQLERKEIEESVCCEGINENKELVKKLLNQVKDCNNIIKDLDKQIEIENLRTKMVIIREPEMANSVSEKYELVLDDVKYIDLKSGNTYQEAQMEIELKSSYQNRLNMKRLTDELEKTIGELQPIKESKYRRALMFTRQKTHV